MSPFSLGFRLVPVYWKNGDKFFYEWFWYQEIRSNVTKEHEWPRSKSNQKFIEAKKDSYIKNPELSKSKPAKIIHLFTVLEQFMMKKHCCPHCGLKFLLIYTLENHIENEQTEKTSLYSHVQQKHEDKKCNEKSNAKFENKLECDRKPHTADIYRMVICSNIGNPLST